MPTILESRRKSAADELQSIVREAETLMGRDDFNPESDEYKALRESRVSAEAHLADLTATLNARALAEAPVQATANGEPISDFRRILREFERGNSDRVAIPYKILRAYDVILSNEPLFAQNPSRISVPEIPVITPSLDSVRSVAVGATYDFVVPPPPVAASTVAENTKKPAVEFTSTKVSGTLNTDAHILDVSRQTLEDDSTAESTLRNWLVEGVKLRQDGKVSAAIAAATGTLTATGPTLLAAIRNGKAALSGIGIRATSVHVNPADAAAIDLEVMANGHTGAEGQSVIFGMSVVENSAIPAGAPIVGDTLNAVYFLYRNSIQTYLTDSGQTVETTPRDRFSHNILGILGEGRSAVHVVQPKLLVKVSVTP